MRTFSSIRRRTLRPLVTINRGSADPEALRLVSEAGQQASATDALLGALLRRVAAQQLDIVTRLLINANLAVLAMHTVGVARVADVVKQEDVHETNLGASAARHGRERTTCGS